MPEHKIQSASGGMNLELKAVPKVLGSLTSDWCPNAFVVSFKLETDTEILFEKAHRALELYSVHVVVANILQVFFFFLFFSISSMISFFSQTRREMVHLVRRLSTGYAVDTLRRDGEDHSLESQIVEKIVCLHTSYQDRLIE